MNLYGRPLTPAIDPAADRVPILDSSAEGDEDKMRDVTVGDLFIAGCLVRTIAGTTPTAGELPADRFAVFRGSTGAIRLWANDAGVMKGVTLA